MHGKVPVPNIVRVMNINTTAQRHQENAAYLYPTASLMFPIPYNREKLKFKKCLCLF